MDYRATIFVTDCDNLIKGKIELSSLYLTAEYAVLVGDSLCSEVSKTQNIPLDNLLLHVYCRNVNHATSDRIEGRMLITKASSSTSKKYDDLADTLKVLR